MSGVVGILHRDGTPPDFRLLREMTDFLAYRGPDYREIWTGPSVGFGHTSLRTRGTGSEVLQLAHLGAFSIAADIRLDSPDELRTKLELAGLLVGPSVPDPMLVLGAYSAWGSECVEHLRGDFAFGIWDAEEKTLFCARDHFGIKPFYYANLGNLFLFSNTLNCLRRHPSVTKTLNETAIGDFLLFGLNYDECTTTFRDIQRLAPAHSLTVSRDSVRTKCYWHLPTEERLRYGRDQEYLDHFNGLLRCAVSDRLHSDSVGILLSGGLDSGSVAAVAKELSILGNGVPELRSYTVGYEPALRDTEGMHAKNLAKYLGISNSYLSLENIELFEREDDPSCRFPEPVDNPLSAGLFDQFREVGVDCRVALSGEGADNLMYFQMWPYLKELGRNRNWTRFLSESAWFLWIRPFPWLGIARRIQSFFSKGSDQLPSWVAPEFARRERLATRWQEYLKLAIPPQRHKARPIAHASMLLPHWTTMCELQDPGVTRCPVEVRYPFLDLRMVDFLLSIPAFPWMYKKRLLRRALVGRFPENLRLRPKTPLSVNPIAKQLRRRDKKLVNLPSLQGRVCEFVRPSRIRPFCDRIAPEQFRPYCLAAWLKAID